jgi:conjugal transfer/entry exclusion protein
MYIKKPPKKLEPIEDVHYRNINDLKVYIGRLEDSYHESGNKQALQALIDKWKDKLERLEKGFTQAERIAYLAKKIDSYKFKNNYDESVSETDA